MTDTPRPRHSLSNDSFDEAFAIGDSTAGQGAQADRSAGAAGRASGSALAASAAANPQQRTPSSAAPLRGLAMILLAVALVLIGWGAYSIFGSEDKDAGNTAAPSTSQDAQQNNSAEPGTRSGNPSPAQQPGQPTPNQPNPAGNQNSPGATPAAPQPAPGQVDRAQQQVTVLNNSAIQGLAGQTATTLRNQNWKRVGLGNLPDSQGVFPRSVVLYPASDANARASAEQIAADLGISAQARTPEVDSILSNAQMLEGAGPQSVVIVATNDLPRR